MSQIKLVRCELCNGLISTDKIYKKYLAVLTCFVAVNLYPLFIERNKIGKLYAIKFINWKALISTQKSPSLPLILPSSVPVGNCN